VNIGAFPFVVRGLHRGTSISSAKGSPGIVLGGQKVVFRGQQGGKWLAKPSGTAMVNRPWCGASRRAALILQREPPTQAVKRGLVHPQEPASAALGNDIVWRLATVLLARANYLLSRATSDEGAGAMVKRLRYNGAHCADR
jgi:hypothetical protein